MYTNEQLATMTPDQLKVAVQQLQGTTPQQEAQPETSLKAIVQQQVLEVLQSQQPKAVSWTESFLGKHQVSPQVAGAIALGAVGGVMEIIKALLQILLK